MTTLFAASRSPSIATCSEGETSRSERWRPPLAKPASRCSPQVCLEGVDAEEDRDPAVADLGRHLDRFAADRADEDRDLVALGVEVELQRLALAAGQRQLVVLALVVDRALAGDDLAHDFDVLAGAAPGLGVGHAVPALGDLRAGGAEAEEEAAAGELVDRRPGHRRRRRRARRDLEDRGAELDRRRLRRQPGEHADHVGAVGLGRPDRLEAGRSRPPARPRRRPRRRGRCPSSRG